MKSSSPRNNIENSGFNNSKSKKYLPFYYLGALIDTVGSYAGSIMKSMLSCCVAPDELGKIYALLSALDNLFPLGVTEGYSLIFEVSLRFMYMQNFLTKNLSL